jgi:hypothetical protein
MNDDISPEFLKKVFSLGWTQAVIAQNYYTDEPFDAGYEEIQEDFKKLRDIPVKFIRHTNYDCINSHYYETNGFNQGYSYDGYMKQIMQLLRISPADFNTFQKNEGLVAKGHFPTTKKKSFVALPEFWEEIINRSSEGHLCIIGTIKASELITFSEKPVRFKIPKGNCVGFFSSSCGGGSTIECPLLADYTIDTTRDEGSYDYWKLSLELPNDNFGYTCEQVYSPTRSWWRNNITIEKVIYDNKK